MASIGDTTRPAFAYDEATDTWVPVGVGPHSHTPAAIGAISNSLTTTTGDLIYAASANTPARLGIGSTGQILTVSGGVPAWAAAPSSGGMTLLASGSLSGSSVTLSSISQSYKSLKLWITGFYSSSNANFLINANGSISQSTATNSYDTSNQNPSGDDMYLSGTFYNSGNSYSFIEIDVADYTGDHAKKFESSYVAIDTGGSNWLIGNRQGLYFGGGAAISSLVLKPSIGTFTGSYALYGVK